MSAQYVQEVGRLEVTTTGTTAIITLAAGVSVPAGHTLLVVATAHFGSSQNVSSVVDSQGNTYTRDVNTSASTVPLCIAKADITTALAAGDTITVTYSGTTSTCRLAVAHEFRFLDTVAVDKTATASGTSTSPSSGNTATTTQADALLFGAVVTNWGGSTPTDNFTQGSGYTKLPMVATSSGSTQKKIDLEYKTVAATGTYPADGTLGASATWRAGVGAYKGGTVTATPRVQVSVIG